jgi:hypothetical protein
MQNPPATTNESDADLTPKVIALTQQFLRALPENELTEIVVRVEPAIERLSLGLFRLVVMGEIKKGKSSLINALLGEPDLLPTASDVATSTVYKILYGPEPACTVFFEADPEKPDEPGRTLTIERAQLPEYGTEDGNPHNAKGVDFIGLELPHPLLREGLVIIDTPGVGGLFRAHRDIAYRYVPLADAVFFVLDSVAAVIGADEIRFLKDLVRHAPRLCFIQTKTDSANTEQCKGWRERNLDILAAELGRPRESLPYFCVSAKLKALADADRNGQDLVDSGFVHLMHYLQHGLLARKGAHLAGKTGGQVLAEMATLRQRLADQRTLAATTSAEELKKHEEALTTLHREATAWESGEMQRRLQTMQDELEDLRSGAADQIQNAFDPGGDLVTRFLAIAKERFATAEVIQSGSKEFIGNCATECADLARSVTESYQETAQEIVEHHVALARSAFTERLKPAADLLGPVRVGDAVAVRGGAWEKVCNAAAGFRQGGIIGGIVAGGLAIASVASAPVWIAVGLGTLAVSIFGAFKSYRAGEERRLDEARAKLERCIRETVTSASRSAARMLKELSTTVTRSSRDLVHEFVRHSQDELKTRLREAQNARRRTASETQTRVKELDNRLAVLDRLGTELATLVPPPAA